MNEIKKYTIGELAEAAGISRRSVRFYVQTGVISPPVGLGRFCFYTEQHLLTIRIHRRHDLKTRQLTVGSMDSSDATEKLYLEMESVEDAMQSKLITLKALQQKQSVEEAFQNRLSAEKVLQEMQSVEDAIQSMLITLKPLADRQTSENAYQALKVTRLSLGKGVVLELPEGYALPDREQTMVLQNIITQLLKRGSEHENH